MLINIWTGVASCFKFMCRPSGMCSHLHPDPKTGQITVCAYGNVRIYQKLIHFTVYHIWNRFRALARIQICLFDAIVWHRVLHCSHLYCGCRKVFQGNAWSFERRNEIIYLLNVTCTDTNADAVMYSWQAGNSMAGKTHGTHGMSAQMERVYVMRSVRNSHCLGVALNGWKILVYGIRSNWFNWMRKKPEVCRRKFIT